MARRQSDSRQATETLEEIESVFSRMADWVSENPRRFLLGLFALLATAALVGWVQSARAQRSAAAAADIGAIQAAFLAQMGANPGNPSFVEPANAESAREIRRDHAAQLLEAAARHEGSAAAAAARLEAGALLAEAGDSAEAAEAWRAAAQNAPKRSAVAATAWNRLAAAEPDGAEASRLYEQAARVKRYPLARLALAQAARSAAEAGNTPRALALLEELEAEESSAEQEEGGLRNWLQQNTPWLAPLLPAPPPSPLPLPPELLTPLRELKIRHSTPTPPTAEAPPPAEPETAEAEAEAAAEAAEGEGEEGESAEKASDSETSIELVPAPPTAE